VCVLDGRGVLLASKQGEGAAANQFRKPQSITATLVRPQRVIDLNLGKSKSKV